MKTLLAILFFITIQVGAEELPPGPQCPQIAGEYVLSRCPAENTAFYTMKILQPNCTTIGYANISYSKEGVPTQNNLTTWDVIGAGRMHYKETTTHIEYIERVYSNNSLFRYTYTVDKQTNKVTQLAAGALNLLANDNILSTYFNTYATYINVKNCKSVKRFF